MVKILKELKGLSGSKIFLNSDDNKIFVRKYFNIERNLERYSVLEKNDIKVPKIYEIGNEYYDMEYIKNIDMKNYLLRYDINFFIDFLISLFDKFQQKTVNKNYLEVYENKLNKIEWNYLSFSIKQLIKKLPKNLPHSIYHGDLSLDNILYNLDSKEFILIDPLTTEYDSFVFDLAKLNQDLVCQWFIRDQKYLFFSKLKKIQEELYKKYDYAKDKYLIILMLLRIFPYCKSEYDKKFILTNVSKLWT
jgi:hypothetical protein